MTIVKQLADIARKLENTTDQTFKAELRARRVEVLATKRNLERELKHDDRDLAKHLRDHALAVAELADAKALLAKASTDYMRSTIRECIADTNAEIAGYVSDINDTKRCIAETLRELGRQ